MKLSIETICVYVGKKIFWSMYTFSRMWYFPHLLYVPSVVSVMSSPELNFNLYMLS